MGTWGLLFGALQIPTGGDVQIQVSLSYVTLACFWNQNRASFLVLAWGSFDDAELIDAEPTEYATNMILVTVPTMAWHILIHLQLSVLPSSLSNVRKNAYISESLVRI